MRKIIKLFQNPYSVDIDKFGANLYMEDIKLQNNDVLKTIFKESNNLQVFNSNFPEIDFKCYLKFS